VTVFKKRLANGLTLLCEPARDAPVVAVQAWVKVGAADETDEIAGIAHVHEHMLFKGTRDRPVGQIAREVEAAGGEINAWTAHDETVYHVILESGQWRLGLDVLADALLNSEFERDELARELEVIMEEIRRSQDIPARRVSHALFALAYTKHPYGRPVLGFTHTVQTFTRDQLLHFFEEHYRPELTTLVITGDVDPPEVERAVTETLGAWRARGPRALRSHAVEPAAAQAGVKILRESVKETRLALAWHIPAMAHADTAALDAMAVVLGHGDASRLYERIRQAAKLVNDVYAYAYTPAEPGLLTVGATLQAKDVLAALEAILNECYALTRSPVSQDELARAKTTILSEAAYQSETVQGLARRRGFFEVVCGDFELETAYNERVRALTPADLTRVARTHLDGAPSVVVQMPEGAEELSSSSVVSAVQRSFAGAASVSRSTSTRDNQGVELVTLESGVRVLLRPELCPVVAMRAVCLGGQRWEQREQQGISALFSSVWGLATEKLSAAALAQRVAELGGSLVAFSGRNTVGLRAEFLSDNARRGLDVFLDALTEPVWEEAGFSREKHAALERIRNREDHPQVVAFETFARELYPTHPYGLRLSGTVESIEPLTAAHVADYYGRFVDTDDHVVVVTGGFTGSEVMEVLAERLGSIGSGRRSEPPPRDPPPDGPRHVRLHLEKKQAHVIVGSMGMSLTDVDRTALDVLTTILSGQGGRLFADLRDRRSLAYSVSASSVEGLDPGHALIYLATSPDKVDRALCGVYEHLEQVCEHAVSDAELDRAQRYLAGSHAIDLQRTGARAMTMGLDECCGPGYAHFRHYAERVRAVTPGDVLRVAQRHLVRTRLIEVVVGP